MPSSFSTGGSYSPIYGGIPQLPNPVATAGQAVSGDLGNLNQLLALLGGIDTSQESQLLSNISAAIPNYSALVGAESGNTAQELAGKVPQDVINQIAQGAAERGISTGSPGSNNSNAAYLRALGLTSIGQQQTGAQNLATMATTAPMAPLFNPSSFLVTPEQQQSAAAAQSIYNAAPIPAAAAAKAMQIAGAAGGTSGPPWWAQASQMPLALGPGSTNVGGVWHTPAMA